MNLLSNDSIKLIKKTEKYKRRINIKISENKYFTRMMKKIIYIHGKYNKIDNYSYKQININLQDNSYFIGKNIRNKIKLLKNVYEIHSDKNLIVVVTNKKYCKIEERVKKTIHIINTLKKLFGRENAYQKLTIYDINQNKNLPKKINDTIGPENCNSGYCNVLYNENINGDIVLYRNEEFYKVLIHESIHANFIDYNIILQQKKHNLDNEICTDYNILLNEAFTETFACLINSVFIYYYTKIDINIIFKNEIKFMLNNFIKLMNHYGINNLKDIIVKNKCKRYFKQKTNVFSYYILKTINYLYINDFLSIMKVHSNKFYCIKNNKFNKNYVNFIFQKIMYLNKYIKNQKMNDYKLKLSLYEMKIEN